MIGDFFESAHGPTVTFGALGAGGGGELIYLEPKAEAEARAKREFLARFGHPEPQNAQEAIVLNELVVEAKRTGGVSAATRVAQRWEPLLSSAAALVTIGGAVVFLTRTRRRNPRRVAPWLVVGGLAAAAWLSARRAVADAFAETRLPATAG